MTRALSVVLAVALCTGWSTAQAAPPKLQLHPDTIKALAEAWAAASKESHTPPSFYVKAKEGIADAAGIIKNLGLIFGVPSGFCYYYEPCNKTATDVGSSLHLKIPDDDRKK
jgi:hypothetical protein